MATKVVITRTGKRRYRSEIMRDRRKHDAYKAPDGSFWADHEPRRDYGVYGNEPTFFKMNGEVIRHAIGFDEYQDKAWDLALPQCKNATYMVLGLGEAGEIQGKHKKLLRGDYEGNDASGELKTEALRNDIKAELGDLQWYIAGTAKAYGIKLSEIAESNISKLNDRRRRGVLQGSGDNR